MTDNGLGNEFKYIMQDLYRLYFGAKCTYREILESDETYTRFKALCRHYLITEVDQETTLESHLYYLTPEDEAAEVYRGLGARVRLSVPSVKKGITGKVVEYRESVAYELMGCGACCGLLVFAMDWIIIRLRAKAAKEQL